jgi:addiction module RelE/StbE family toxin
VVSKVIWSPAALEDLRSITSYIAQSSPLAAHRIGEKLIGIVESLDRLPNRGRMVPERKRAELRELICSPYRIAYVVHADKSVVHVLRLWHAARGDIVIPPLEENA